MQRTHRPAFATILAATLLGACAPPASAQSTKFVDVGRGDVPVYLPSTYDENTPMPLIIMLHGYGASGAIQESYFRFRNHQESLGFILTIPDGTVDNFGNRFWNATDACCNFSNSTVDDSTYILDLINAIKAECNVAPRSVSIVGHSNGGFMANRFACDHADVVASFASLAGATHDDPNDCNPATTVHMLQIHGTADTTIRYNGGFINGNRYPGAIETVESWAASNGCALVPDDSSPPLDLDRTLPGDETLVTIYPQDCDAGGSAELWTIVDGAHVPNLSTSFSPLVIEWLLDHPKPCLADFNNDGTSNTQDVIAFLNAWAAGESAADFNGDGEINTQDVLAFLNAWAAGC